MNDKIVVVIPCYNEATRLDSKRFVNFVQVQPLVHFVMVDDGSSDQTHTVLSQIASAAPDSFTVHQLPKNQGKQEAVRQGMQVGFKKRPRYIGFWDADLATPLESIAKFADQLEMRPKLHMIMGARVKLLGRFIARHMARHYAGRVFATAASIVLDLGVYDTQCGAKLFRCNGTTEKIFSEPFRVKWIFDVELIARMKYRLGLPVEEVIYEFPLDQWSDVAGSKVKTRDFFRAFFDLLTVFRHYRLGKS